jgi:hypothetical protein
MTPGPLPVISPPTAPQPLSSYDSTQYSHGSVSNQVYGGPSVFPNSIRPFQSSQQIHHEVASPGPNVEDITEQLNHMNILKAKIGKGQQEGSVLRDGTSS